MRVRNTPPGGVATGTVAGGLRRVGAASMAGTVVEWYEFFLYGTAATLVFGKVFFAAGGSDLDGVLDAFITYAVGFAARPLGGIVFGHYGDKFGRKKLLQTSLLLVGLSTFGMGCLPTFHQAGYWAPALLVALRFVQGFAVGGEWGGAVLLVAEHSPSRGRGFWASWPQAGVPAGNMLATVVLLVLTSTLSDAAFLSWGWRVAFWLSALIVLIGYYVRTKVTDAPIFLAAQQEAERAKAASYSVVEVLRGYPRGVFTAMGLRFGENVMYYLVVTFSITYLKVHVKADTQVILWWLLAAHAVHFVIIPQVGRLSDCIGRRPVYLIGALATATWGFFAFPMMDSGHDAVIMSAIVVGLVFHAFMYAPQPRDVPHSDAVFRCVTGLSGDLDRRRVARADHRGTSAAQLRIIGADRLVSRRCGGDHAGGCRVHPGNPRPRPAIDRRGGCVAADCGRAAARMIAGKSTVEERAVTSW